LGGKWGNKGKRGNDKEEMATYAANEEILLLIDVI